MSADLKATILVVDDEDYLRRLVVRMLEKYGYACVQAADGREALDKLSEQEFGLVISDITMPVMTGLELLEAAKELHPDAAFIMLTGLDNQETGVRALKLGAYGYIIKPFKENALLINVANAFRRRDLEKMRDDYEHHLKQEVHERTMEIRSTQEEVTIRLVTASEFRDEETGAHIKRMGNYSALIAQSIGWDTNAVDNIKLAAPMHDVGKIGVPDSILLKPGKLTKKEFELIKTHTTIGAQILANSDIPILRMAYEIALSHHEKFDGSGYPQSLRGNDIPLSARIVAVCDVYDALSNDRVYRSALPEDQVLSIMTEGRKSHFDPDIFDQFLHQLPKFRRIRQSLVDR